jgi:microcystin-dependent protein
MSEPFVGEIKIFAGNFAPRGWAFCNGQILAISQNSALFSILGTTYGGDGRTTFALPDLRGRVPIHAGTGPGLSPYQLGQRSGVENVTLGVNQIPAHGHPINVSSPPVVRCSNQAGTTNSPVGNVLAQAPGGTNVYRPGAPNSNMNIGGFSAGLSIGNTGGGQQHTNVQPFLSVHFIIALQGIYPSRE